MKAPPPPPAIGLSFDAGRKLVRDSFKKALKDASDPFLDAPAKLKNDFASYLLWLTVPTLIAMALYLTSAFETGSAPFQTGTIATVSICFVLVVLNVIFIGRYQHALCCETTDELQAILSDYEAYLALVDSEFGSPDTIVSSNVAGRESAFNTASRAAEKLLLPSGHSRISIVNVFRNNRWLKLPSLLLAEGDIIALMGGDVTPGKVFELDLTPATATTPEDVTTGRMSPGRTDTIQHVLRRKCSIEAGESVYISSPTNPDPSSKQAAGVPPASTSAAAAYPAGESKKRSSGNSNNKPPSAAVTERHRSLAPDSVELLRISGNTRCFELAETPLGTFVRNIIKQKQSQTGPRTRPSDTGSNQSVVPVSFIRSLLMVSLEQGVKVGVTLVVLFVLAQIIRTSVLEESAVHWGTSFCAPLATLLMIFSALYLPLILLVGEALATADILVSTESILQDYSKSKIQTVPNRGADADSQDPSQNNDGDSDSKIMTASTLKRERGNSVVSSMAMSETSTRAGMESTGSGYERSSLHVRDNNSDDSSAFESSSHSASSNNDLSKSRGFFGFLPLRHIQYSVAVLAKRLYFARDNSTTIGPSSMVVDSASSSSSSSPSPSSLSSSSTSSSVLEKPLLSIPLGRSRVCETLGAITMVCFIDDDVVCENYSVTEEIFLLADNKQAAMRAGTTTAGSKSRHDKTAPHASSNASTAVQAGVMLMNSGGAASVVNSAAMAAGGGLEGETRTSGQQQQQQHAYRQPSSKGIVLDLHANAHASGSRFEDPQWWLHLPSLKPLGLNALLTYKSAQLNIRRTEQENNAPSSAGYLPKNYSPSPPPLGRDHHFGDGVQITALLPSSAAMMSHSPFFSTQPGQSGKPQSHMSYTTVASADPLSSSSHGHFGSQAETGSLRGRGTFSTVPGQSGKPPAHIHLSPPADSRKGTRKMLFQQQQYVKSMLEHTLVEYIQHAAPLEALHEVAEEIGFTPSDGQHFVPRLEVDVFAPGLRNKHRQEDQHTWGQEESRRRGSLVPQLRGRVFSDSRTGALQLMSIGDPKLLLSYSREYWDGSSISPMTANDRRDILHIFERWRLEDFDVIAFSYTPLAANSLKGLTPSVPIMTTTSNSTSNTTENNTSNSGAGKGEGGEGDSSTVPVPVVVFVDPSKDEEYAKKNNNIQQQQAAPQSVPRPLLLPLPTAGTDHRAMMAVDPLVVNTSYFPSNPRTLSISHPASTGSLALLAGGSPVSPATRGLINGGGDTNDDGDEEKAFEAKDDTVIFTSPFSDSAKDNNTGGVLLPMSTTKVGLSGSAPLICVDEDATVAEGSGGGRDDDGDGIEGKRFQKIEISTSAAAVSSSSASSSSAESSSGGGNRGKFSPLNSNSQHAADEDLYDYEDNISLASETKTNESGDLDHHHDDDHGHEEHGGDLHVKSSGSIQPSSSSSSPLGAKGKSLSLDQGLCSYTSLLVSSSPASSTLTQGEASSPSSSLLLPLTVKEQLNATSEKLRHSSPSDGELNKRSSEAVPVEAENSTGRKSVMASSTISSSPSLAAPPLTFPPALLPAQVLSSFEGATAAAKGSSSPHNSHKPRHHAAAASLWAGSGEVAAAAALGLQQTRDKLSAAAKLEKRASTKQLWSFMRQQVFLGMAASSVPVRTDVPYTMEHLSDAGIRFVYFSPRNMKRSKPVAEKIGLAFDWNCAISLRELDPGVVDPHRHISNYADWDVLARMPHGVAAIKEHLQTVDNVPLLVSLYTDATPHTVKEMVGVFQEYGEVILSIGSAYRADNRQIYEASDIAASISAYPGVIDHLPAAEADLVARFPVYSHNSLAQMDILLSCRLVGLGTSPLVQAPFSTKMALQRAIADREGSACASVDNNNYATINPEILFPAAAVSPRGVGDDHDSPELRLNALLEAVETGRVILLNMVQCLAFLCLSVISLGLWVVLSTLIPFSITPSAPPAIMLLFLLLYLPVLTWAHLMHPVSSAAIMKTTPRKRTLNRRDEGKFMKQLAVRAGFVGLSIFLVGWFTAASTTREGGGRQKGDGLLEHLGRFHNLFDENEGYKQNGGSDLQAFWLVQDMMANQALLALLSQSFTLLERGQLVFGVDKAAVLKFLKAWCSRCYCLTVALCVAVHVLVMSVRAAHRECRWKWGASVSTAFSNTAYDQLYPMCAVDGESARHTYSSLSWIVWLLMIVLPVVGMLLSFAMNAEDAKGYRRHMQFLRLEFDTKLGMHSPR